ncbi:MAG: c-type cytochrome [Phycisphaerae bacterium]|jgi:putative membrane-bound dehydrogenase-like protein|nr:c-type cytochrome [Phycisphaerae bacterium]
MRVSSTLPRVAILLSLSGLTATLLVTGGWTHRPPPGASKELPADRPTYDGPPKIRPIAGLQASLFAKEPLVADPVAFCFDDEGRMFIAESARQEVGVEDNRSSKWWLMDDLQSQTTADRLAMYEKWAEKREGGMAYYRQQDDRVRRIEDSNGDGRADRQLVFAGPFNEPLDGTGAGVIAREGEVWYTNIPNLWRLIDRDGDGVAEVKDKVYSGFGVRVALRGHDMHGLAWGPDGKLYWSIGDRGYHLTLEDGTVLADPRSGAVFRCNADGSNIEIYCRSLRNPQELAFDDFGNLITGDNNSDGGDKARIVYCVEGGETGWSMDYQTLEGTNLRGPWNQEETWALRPDLAPDKTREFSKVQPAWTVPPLAHVGSGPSGLVHYPGLGLEDRYRDAFFLCDFLGGDAYSRVLAFRLEPFGAGFRVVDVHPFIENVLPTDVDFGYDGKFYVSDWGGGWYSKGYGEVYSVWDPKAIQDPRVSEVTSLFREGFRQRESAELRHLLGHADQRVRLRAQFALAERGPAVVELLTREAAVGASRLARIHAIWGLGMVAADGLWPAAVAGLVERLDDVDAEVRAQSAKVIGEARFVGANRQLLRLLTDDTPRVRYFAAMALGRLGVKEAHAPIVALLAENDGKDVFLRHAGVTALAWLKASEETRKLATEPQVELRLCSALVMRRWRDGSIVRFLQDADDRVVAEAARAINDIPMPDAMPRLVELGRRFIQSEGSSDSAANEFRRDVWLDVKGAGEAKLDDDATFAAPPSETQVVAVFEGRSNAGNNYLQRVSGLITAPMTGPYVFQISSDDGSILYLSADESPATKLPIASVDGYSGRGEWDGQASQTSQPVLLEAGKRYYLEARHAEGGGDDFVAVGWKLPDGSFERPIGGGVYPPLVTPLVRRVINACVRSDDLQAAISLAGLARSAKLPDQMRVEALAGLAEWLKPSPRDRVNGAYRAVDPSKRDTAGYVNVLKQKLPGLVQHGSPAVRSAARELASTAGITLDGAANFDVVADERQPVEERAACLRQLCNDSDRRATEAIDLGLASKEWALRAESRKQLVRRDAQRGASEVRAGLTATEPKERQAAIQAIRGIESGELEDVAAELAARLEGGELEESLRLDVLAVMQERPALSSRALTYLAKLDQKSPRERFGLALEGGDAKRGFDLVHYHMSATCLKCHTVGGTGGDAAPKLDGVATRLNRRELLQSLVEPNAVVAKGFGEISAMPQMGAILTLEELRDVVEYLSTVR